MADDTPNNGVEYEFVGWLKRNKLQAYQQALEDEGYEELESLVLLDEKEIEELSAAVEMKAGHRKKFPVAIQTAREDLKKDKAKREREEEEQEEKRKKDKEEQEEKDKMEKELATELAKIEGQKLLELAKARSKREQKEVDTDKTDAKPSPDSTGLANMPVSNTKMEPSKDTAVPGKTTTKSEESKLAKSDGRANKAPDLPDGFKYHYFAS